MLYLLYIFTLCLFNMGLIYMINGIAFRIRGQTLISHVDPKSPLYNKLRRRVNNQILSLNAVLLLFFACCLIVEIRALQDMNKDTVAGPLLFGIVLVIIVDIMVMWLVVYGRRNESATEAKQHPSSVQKKNDWLV